MLLNCGVGEDSWESLGLQGDPGCSLEGLMLKLKLHYFGHLMWRTDSFEKTLMLGKIEGGRRRGRQDEMVGWHHQLYRPWVWVNSGSWWCTGKPGVLQSMGSQRVGHDWVTELNWSRFNKEKANVKKIIIKKAKQETIPGDHMEECLFDWVCGFLW